MALIHAGIGDSRAGFSEPEVNNTGPSQTLQLQVSSAKNQPDWSK